MKREGFLTLLFFAIIAVLVVTHPQGFASAVTAVGGQTYNETGLLTGTKSVGGTTGTVNSTTPGTYSLTSVL